MARDYIAQLISSYPAVVIVGPRGCGKTTIARTFSDLCFNIECERDVARLEFLWEDCMNSGELVVLEEMHQKPELFLRLRAVLDEYQGGNGQFLITESFCSSMIDNLGDRSTVCSLTPLLVNELGTGQYDRLWRNGAYPEVWNSEVPLPFGQQLYLDQMIQLNLPNVGLSVLPSFTERLFKILAALHGTIYNASRIGKSLGVSYHTINSYVEYLVRAGLVRFLSAARLNLRKRLVKSPKLYWRDSGLFHALVGLNSEDDLFSKPWVGASWEGWVIEQICNRLEAEGESVNACHFSTSDQYSLDLLLDFRGKRWAIDTTISSSPPPEIMVNLAKAAELVGADHALLISRSYKPWSSQGVVSLGLGDALAFLLDRSEAP